MRKLLFSSVCLFLGSLAACVADNALNDYHVVSEEKGIASFYSDHLHEGPTASGETYDHGALTAAHKSLPFDTMVRVVHLESGRSVIVRINDRGPFVEGRIIDLSGKAAEKLKMKKQGLAKVRVEVLEQRSEEEEKP